MTVIYTIKTQGCVYISISISISIYVYICLYVCSELIEETGRFPNVIFGTRQQVWVSTRNFSHLEKL